MITLTTSPNNPNAKPQVQTQMEMRPMQNQGITSRRTHEGNLTQVLYSWIYLYNTNDHTTLT